jgi:hypothetical protein
MKEGGNMLRHVVLRLLLALVCVASAAAATAREPAVDIELLEWLETHVTPALHEPDAFARRLLFSPPYACRI